MIFRTSRFSTNAKGPSHPETESLILGEDCARWMIETLPSQGVAMDAEPCWEDWGWEAFATVDGCRFWIGTSAMFTVDDPPDWIIHVHHFTFLKRFTSGGRRAMERVTAALDRILRDSPDISEVRWHREADVFKNRLNGGTEHPDAP
jgi:hypothetical protein